MSGEVPSICEGVCKFSGIDLQSYGLVATKFCIGPEIYSGTIQKSVELDTSKVEKCENTKVDVVNALVCNNPGINKSLNKKIEEFYGE